MDTNEWSCGTERDCVHGNHCGSYGGTATAMIRRLLILLAFCALPAAAQTPLYGTYFGGSNSQFNTCTLIDSATGDYIAWGGTSSTNLPTASAFQSTYGGGSQDGFLTSFSHTTGAVVWSTYIGGSSVDTPTKSAQDGSGNIFVTG